jgi:hypothetical protein
MDGKMVGRLAVAGLILGLGSAQAEARGASHAICPIRHVCTNPTAAGGCPSYIVHISCREPHAKFAGAPAAERRLFE